MSSTVEKRLAESLGRRADGLDALPAEPIRLADVRSRATSLRRRRRFATGAGTAAVLALLVPAGILGVNGWDRAEPPPVTTPSPTPIAEPVTVDVDVEQGPQPRAVWIDGPRVHLPDGTVLDAARSYVSAHLVAGKVLALRNDPDTGFDEVDELGATGEVLATTPIQDGMVIADDRSAAVWQTRDGGLQLLNGDGLRDLALDVDLRGATLDALEGGDECTRGCALWFGDARDGSPSRLDLDTLEAVPVRGPLGVHDVRQDLYTGLLSLDEREPGSCSAVYEGLVPLWQTCDHSLDTFSPDGRWVGATDEYVSGAGVGTAVVLDAGTGDRLVEFDAGDGWFTQRVWEDETHLLAAHYLEDARTWQVFRLGLDGTVELAVAPQPGSMDELGLILPE